MMKQLIDFLIDGDKAYREKIIKKLENDEELSEQEIDYITDYVSTYSRFIERRREKCKETTSTNTNLRKQDQNNGK